jgi:hypothetical protein
MPKNQQLDVIVSAGQRTGYAQVSHSLDGRMEKRLPIIIVVRLSRMRHLASKEEERTYTDNISAHGVRVFSKGSWQPGEQAEVTPSNEESPMHGEVVYCQRVGNDQFCIGLKFQGRPIPWSTLRRYDGK